MVMATTSAAPPLTYEDYLTLPDDRNRHEIIAGEKYVSPAPTTPHQRVVQHLHLSLGPYVEEHAAGDIFLAPCDVLLSDTDIVQPDLLFVAVEQSSIVQERGIEGAPDLIAEVVSEGNRRHDEIRKRKLYARHGVTEYWVVDPALETVKSYREPEGGYEQAAVWSAEDEDTITTPLLPEWRLPLNNLFRETR